MRVWKNERLVTSAVCLAAGIGLSNRALATTVFSDTFSKGSTVATGTYPSTSANSTGYAIASSKGQSPTPSIAANHFKFGLASTSSALEETQALFSTSPVNLASVGDNIQLQVNFVDTGILVTGSSTSGQLDFGLYSAGGSAPKTDLSASGIGTGTGDATGGAQNWQGYISQTFFTGGTSKIVTRPQQTAADNTNQDVIGNGFSATGSYHSPAGATLTSSQTPSATLTGGDSYTATLLITLTAANTYQIDSTLFDNTTSTQASTQTTSGVTGSNFINGFDAFAFGWRETGSVASNMDVSSVTVTTTASVPEPGTMALVSLGALGLLRRRKMATR